MTKSRAFIVVLLSFIAGVGIASFLTVPAHVLYLPLMLGAVAMVVFWKKKAVRVGAIAVIFLLAGIVRYRLSQPAEDFDIIQAFNGNKVQFVGVVYEEPDVRQDHMKLTIVSREVEGKKVQGKVLVKSPQYPAYAYGDILRIECELQAPEPIEDFAYDAYLARYDIYSICYRPRIEKEASGEGNPVLSVVYRLKQKFVSRINQVVPEPEASFLGGLILGAKHSIPAWLLEAFQKTGTTHIIALSGFNISIIAVFIQNFCKALWIPRNKAFWISLSAVGLFILMTGGQASIVRAGIMGALVLVARRLGRLSRITNALVFAAFVMVVITPKVLVFDAGFQLSFLATIGLVYLSPYLEKVFKPLPDVFEIRSSMVATLSAIILTTPLILTTFGRFSLIAPLVNVLILPLIPVAMAVGFITGVTAVAWIPLGTVCAWGAWAVLRGILFIVETVAALPYISFEIESFHWIGSAIAYASMGIVLWKIRKKPRMAHAR
ncbi:MAG: ComEC/Rec2-related protein [Parcubacteria group bacterium GW2011_GWC2_49_9]|nr:MAG: ComEC/Rec2-related protein [Parcubacteria group bacterium GW2011_GWC2_49_9]